MFSEDDVSVMADALLDAERSHIPTLKVTVQHGDADITDAYRVATAVSDRKITDGERLIGHKIGLTSRAMQSVAGIDEPDYGRLLTGMFVPEGAVIPRHRLFAPQVEAELAFMLEEELQGPGVTAADVLGACTYVLPCIEIVDFRYTEQGKFTVVDSIADNASAGLVVLGGRLIPIADVDLRGIGVAVARNGVIEETGLAAAVMNNPVNAVAWLANRLAQFGTALEAGHVVLSGSFTRVVPFNPGDVIVADFQHFGCVVVSAAS